MSTRTPRHPQYEFLNPSAHTMRAFTSAHKCLYHKVHTIGMLLPVNKHKIKALQYECFYRKAAAI